MLCDYVECQRCGEHVHVDEWQEHGWMHADSYMFNAPAHSSERESDDD